MSVPSWIVNSALPSALIKIAVCMRAHVLKTTSAENGIKWEGLVPSKLKAGAPSALLSNNAPSGPDSSNAETTLGAGSFAATETKEARIRGLGDIRPSDIPTLTGPNGDLLSRSHTLFTKLAASEPTPAAGWTKVLTTAEGIIVYRKQHPLVERLHIWRVEGTIKGCNAFRTMQLLTNFSLRSKWDPAISDPEDIEWMHRDEHCFVKTHKFVTPGSSLISTRDFVDITFSCVNKKTGVLTDTGLSVELDEHPHVEGNVRAVNHIGGGIRVTPVSETLSKVLMLTASDIRVSIPAWVLNPIFAQSIANVVQKAQQVVDTSPPHENAAVQTDLFPWNPPKVSIPTPETEATPIKEALVSSAVVKEEGDLHDEQLGMSQSADGSSFQSFAFDTSSYGIDRHPQQRSSPSRPQQKEGGRDRCVLFCL